MEYGVSVGVLEVGIGSSGQNQSEALFLRQAGGKTQGVFAPINITIIVGHGAQSHVLVIR